MKINPKDIKNLDFNKTEYEYILENCNFTDRQLNILNLRRGGKSIVAISLELFICERTVNREIKEIKRKIGKVVQS